MKKILLILAIVVCVAVAGSALAVAYYNAPDKEGSVKADQFVTLSLDNSSDIEEIALSADNAVIYKIQCDVTKSATATANATLTIAMAANDGKNINGVTVALYSDAKCETAVEGKTQTGAGTITVTGIAATTTYYAKVTFAGAADAEALALVNGTMTINLAQAA